MRKIGLFTNPYFIISFSFFIVILLGTVLLCLPISSTSGEVTPVVNSFFTATSAVCVTGLIVENTAEYWTTFGHVIIILLIQFGGLGFMTIATASLVLIGKKIGIKDRIIVKEQLNQDSLSGIVKLVKEVIFYTFFIEAIGALFLMLRFIPEYGFKTGLWYSVFHSISGFCNAGFDILGNSIVAYKNDLLINFTIAGLVILGGLGFTVMSDIKRNYNTGRFSLHTKIVLTTSLFLLLFGIIALFFTEYNNVNTIANESIGGKFLISFFQSVVTRTAGFNSIDLSKIRETSAVIMITLMFIGASPASTGGGIKTTTFAVLIMSTLSEIKENKDINIFKKRIPDEIVSKAVAITTIGLIWIILVSLIITGVENAKFVETLFETASAQGTVGMSMGITSSLSNFSKILLSITMFFGRVGGLTVAMAVSYSSTHEDSFRYAEEKLIVG